MAKTEGYFEYLYIFGSWLLLLLLLSDPAAGAAHGRREAERSRNKLDLEGHVGGKADGLKRKVCHPSLRCFLLCLRVLLVLADSRFSPRL